MTDEFIDSYGWVFLLAGSDRNDRDCKLVYYYLYLRGEINLLAK